MLAHVVGQGLRPVLVGIAVGLAGAVGVTRLLGALLYDTSALDPLTLAGVAALIALVSLAAAWIPARRATRIDPLAALRT